MHCIKLLGDKLSARSFDSQVNEIHARVAVLNRFTELGRPLTRQNFGAIRSPPTRRPDGKVFTLLGRLKASR